MYNELFYYDGVNLRNKVARNPRAPKDSIAGSKHHSGYYHVKINGKLVMVHRVIWEMINGKIPEDMEIDHINHKRDDNRLDNLRLVTKRDNRRNQSISSRNTSGVTGVYFIKRLNKWGSQIKVTSGVLWLGTYENKEDAIKARKEAELKYNFHDNHGKSNTQGGFPC